MGKVEEELWILQLQGQQTRRKACQWSQDTNENQEPINAEGTSIRVVGWKNDDIKK